MHLGKLLLEATGAAGVAVKLLGPAPAPIARLRGLHRFHLQLQSTDAAGLHAAVRKTIADLKPPEDVQWIVDVDPLDML